MNATLDSMVDAAGEFHAVHLLLTEGEPKKLAHDPEWWMADIETRATEVGSVLEGILHESHGIPRWGLNE